MQTALKIVLGFALFLIFLQDFKERQVFLWTFLLSAVLMAYLHFKNTLILVFLSSIFINLLVILLIVLVLYTYSIFKLKKPLNETLGLGDIIFFLTLAIGFSTGTFLILFTFSLIFALVIYLVIKSKLEHKTIPLAGLQALFVGIIYSSNWILNFTNLYAI